jgi:hypothetical protein
MAVQGGADGPVPSRMPSLLHEAHLLLFRNEPTLAPALIRDVLRVELPSYQEARIVSADLTDVQPAEYRADLVVQLFDGESVCGIVVEVQLSAKEPKRFAWLAYVVNLHARLKCPVHLLIVTADDAVARWASQPIEIGGRNRFTPLVLGPSAIPEIVDDVVARANPELAVLSTMAHGRDSDADKCARIALAARRASEPLDDDRSRMYVDLIENSLSEAARQALMNMDPQKYVYQSEFARKYFGEGVRQGVEQGVAQGEARGRVALLARQLALRFGPLSEPAQNRLRAASIEELDAMGERLLTASTLEAALD